jgi:hypothetical protein
MKLPNILQQSFIIDLIFILAFFITSFIILYPLQNAIRNYDFYYFNLVLIALFFFYTRMSFLLHHSFLSNRNAAMIAFMLLSILLLSYITIQFQEFVVYKDGDAYFQMKFKNLMFENENTRSKLIDYMEKEMAFFYSAYLVALIYFIIKIFLQIWNNWKMKFEN